MIPRMNKITFVSICFLIFPRRIHFGYSATIADTAVFHAIAPAWLIITSEFNLNLHWAMLQHLTQFKNQTNDNHNMKIMSNDMIIVTRIFRTWRKTLMGWRPHMVFLYSCIYWLKASVLPTSMISIPMRSNASIDLWMAPWFSL
jgi:hypothetical protein